MSLGTTSQNAQPSSEPTCAVISVTEVKKATSSTLFTPLKLGKIQLSHRIVLAPLSRLRANKNHVHGDLAVEYYSQRGRSIPGTLLITEATYVSAEAGGGSYIPGIWNDEQVAAWKKVADAVHREGSYIFMQLWALGRTANPENLKEENPEFPFVSSSDVPLSTRPSTDPIPRPLSVAEIKKYVHSFGEAAFNAVHRAGMDGVEIHAANGYLVDQFLQDTCNRREDAYGGSVENRCRFALEVVGEVVNRIGAERVGVRVSPWSTFQDMRMADPIPTFTHFVSRIVQRHPIFAYLHAIEPRVRGDDDCCVREGETNDFLRTLWGIGPGAERRIFISAGGYTAHTAATATEQAALKGQREMVAFGRAYIANPDLPLRVKLDIPLTPYARQTFCVPESASGYIDYPFAEIPGDGPPRPETRDLKLAEKLISRGINTY